MDPAAQESALAVVVPEAEGLVGSFRLKYDPVARLGMPAHITVLYPFVHPIQIDQKIEQSLRELFRSQSPFDFELTEIREFPGVLYLALNPDRLFRKLTAAVYAQFPAYPPYGGAISDPTPHLTVGQATDPQDLKRLRMAFAHQANDVLPILARAMTVTLLENYTGKWQVRTTFELGG